MGCHFLLQRIFLTQGLNLCLIHLLHWQETQETWVQSLGQEYHMEKKMVTCSSILVWKIPWVVERGGLQSMGPQRVGHDWATATTNVFCLHFVRRVFSFCLPSPYLLPTTPVPRKQLHLFFWICFSLCPFPLLSGMASQICPLHSLIIFLFVSFLSCSF